MKHAMPPSAALSARVARRPGCIVVLAVALLVAGADTGHTQVPDPFGIAVALIAGADAAGPALRVDLRVPEGHYLYRDQIELRVVADEPQATLAKMPETRQVKDAYLDKTVAVFDRDTTLLYTLSAAPATALTVEVSYQGCSPDLCFMPQTRTFVLDPAAVKTSGTSGVTAGQTPGRMDAAPADWTALVPHFELVGREAGYLAAQPFLAFIESATSGEGLAEDALAGTLRTRGMWLTILVIVLGGLALNLTPCVLPMIPINIAIIGAGAQAGSKGRGFVLGTLYGAGIAAVYGVLGVAVVLTGATFGALNASPWFNLGVAAVFVTLGLAMLDVFLIDFSRLQRGVAGGAGTRRGGGAAITALLFGGLAAMLAGACVAPVVISVLVLATNLYGAGTRTALFLPFLLGIGMALPWPFAGAGLSFLPKPGGWMHTVNRIFAVCIFLAAGWYAYTGIGILAARRSASSMAAKTLAEQAWHTALPDALAEAHQSGKPLFIDFWATWCKACLQMERTTLKDAAVVERLAGHVKLKYQAEDPRAPATKAVLDHFGVLGLPTYVVLRPRAQDP